MNRTRFSMAVALLLCGAVALTLATPALAFIRIARQATPTSPVVQAHWLDSNLPLPSVIDPTNADQPAAVALSAVQASAQSWQDINTSYFTVDAHLFDSTTEIQPSLAFDGQNSVFFLTDLSMTVFPPGVIAFVRSVIDGSTGQTIDADMVFNDRDFFSSVSTPNLTPAPAPQAAVDLQAVITHEYGHYFSLDHTSVLGATMIPFISNNISQRTLERDDSAGVSTVYPESASRPGGLSPGAIDFGATTGSISGTVISGYNGSATFGAHVEAFPLSAPTPANSISAISGELTLRNGMGEYTIHGLLPGPHVVRIVPLDGIHTTAADANVGGPYAGLDINFEVEFWNGASESGNGFTDLAGDASVVEVSPGVDAGGVNFVTNTFPGRVIIAQSGAFENTVTFRNTGYRAVRFDPPFTPPYTISNVEFPTFTFNGVPATFLSVRLCPMNPVTGLPDLAAPLFMQAPFSGNPNGINTVPLNLSVTSSDQTFFWVFQFSTSQFAGFPNNFPFLRMDFSDLERGLFANSYDISLAGAGGILIDRNITVSMTCQMSSPELAPIAAPSNLGANRAAENTEFNYTRPGDVRADGFSFAHALHEIHVLARSPFAYTTVAASGAGAASVKVEPSPPSSPATIWSSQALDRAGHLSIQSNVVILGLNEDADEPNGRIQEAKTLTLPVVARAESYSPAGDQDYFGFSAKPGEIIEARATAILTPNDAANNTDLVMLLFDDKRNLLAFNDDFSGLNPKITFVAPPGPGGKPKARKFKIFVTDYSGSPFNPTGAPQVRTPQGYTLNLSVTAPAVAPAQLTRGLDPNQFFFGNSGPNPANPISKFVYVLPQSAQGSVGVKLRIYSVNGRLVRTLVNRNQEPGPYTAIWDGRDDQGHSASSGTYFARLDADRWTQKTRVTLLK